MRIVLAKGRAVQLEYVVRIRNRAGNGESAMNHTKDTRSFLCPKKIETV